MNVVGRPTRFISMTRCSLACISRCWDEHGMIYTERREFLTRKRMAKWPFVKKFSTEISKGEINQHDGQHLIEETESDVDIVSDWNAPVLVAEKDVLHAFNTLNQVQLYKYRHLSSRLSKAVIVERDTKGPFKDLGDLLRVKGMGRRTLDRFVSEGLRPRGIKIEPLTRFSYAVSGKEQITKERLKVLESIITLDVGLKHIAWLHLDRGRNVRDWQVMDLADINPGKYDPAAYLKEMQRVLDEIPHPDLYVLEHKTYDRTSKTSYHVTLFLRTLESILFGLLNRDYAGTGDLDCISLSQQRIGKHFGLLVGTRRKSGRDIVHTLLENAANPSEDTKVLVKFRQEDSEMFESANNFEKELLANSLLKAVTFFDVFVDNEE